MAQIARLDAILGGTLDPSFVQTFDKAEAKVVNFNKLAEAASELKPFSNATASAIEAAKTIGQLEDVLFQLKIEQKDVFNPTELTAYNNAIRTVSSEIKTLGAQGASSFGNFGKVLTEGFSSLRQIAYILPGIGIAGILGGITDAVITLAKSFFDTTTSTNDATEALRQYAEQADNAKVHLGQLENELASLQKLYAANNKIRFFGNDAEANLIDAQDNLAFVIAKSNDLSNAVQEASDRSSKALEALYSISDKGSKEFQDAQKDYNDIVKEQFDLQNQQKDQLNDVKLARAQVALAQLQYDKAQADSAEAAAKKIAEAQKKAIEAYRKSYRDLISLLNSGKKIFGETAAEKIYTPVQIQPEVTNIEDFNKMVQRQILENTGKQFSDKQGILVPVSLLNDDEVNDGINKMRENLQSVVDVANTLTNAFTQTFEVLLSGGKNAFKALEQALIGLIAKLIATIIEAAILSAILGSITGGSSLVVGGSGFGNILKSLLGSGLQFHAEGGIFTKRTQIGNQVFGEAGPEALIPLDRLQTMLGGMSNQRIEVVGRISGNDIVLIQNRANLRNNRNYGNNFLSFNG